MLHISTFIVLLAAQSTFASSCWDKENFIYCFYRGSRIRIALRVCESEIRFTKIHVEIEVWKRSDPKGADYTGNVAETKSHPRYGIRPCRPWNEMFGKKMPEDGKNHNFCRNPGGTQRAPFCWVKEGFPGPKFGFCDIPDCVSILFHFNYALRSTVANRDSWLGNLQGHLWLQVIDCKPLITSHWLQGQSARPLMILV